jgi:hypothetical protein
MAKFSKFVDSQKKELEKILKNVHALDAAEFVQDKFNEKIGSKIGKKVKVVKKSKASSAGSSKKKAAASEEAIKENPSVKDNIEA